MGKFMNLFGSQALLLNCPAHGLPHNQAAIDRTRTAQLHLRLERSAAWPAGFDSGRSWTILASPGRPSWSAPSGNPVNTYQANGPGR